MSSIDPTDTDHTVTLLTSDNQTKEVSWDVFKRFGLFSPQDDPETRPRDAVPLPNVNLAVLEKVIEYCEYHRNDPWPEVDPKSSSDDPSTRRASEIKEWDQNFIQVDQEMLFEIILAANYLDIKPLLTLGTKTVAKMIKGKTPEEIRKMFNIVNSFTPEEEAQIKKENEWAEDR